MGTLQLAEKVAKSEDAVLIFLIKCLDISSFVCGEGTRCVVEKSGFFQACLWQQSRVFLIRCQDISSCVHGGKTRYFKPKHDCFPIPDQVGFAFSLTRPKHEIETQRDRKC